MANKLIDVFMSKGSSRISDSVRFGFLDHSGDHVVSLLAFAVEWNPHELTTGLSVAPVGLAYARSQSMNAHGAPHASSS